MKSKRMMFLKTIILTTAILALTTPASAVNPRIIVAKGEVLLKRNAWSSYRQINVGARLYSKDLILAKRGTKVVILCPNQVTWEVPSGRIWGALSGCPKKRNRARSDRLPPGILGGTNPNIPYIISPRRSLLLDSKPTLRWNGVPGATTYTVSLTSATGFKWEQQVSDTQVTYPSKPPLEPGVLYSLVVKADTGESSQDEKASGLGFMLLNDTDIEKVKTDIKQITRRELADNDEAQALALASIYTDYILTSESAKAYDLNAEDIETYSLNVKAIEVLEDLIQKNNETPSVYRLLGDLYWHSGLQLLAEAQYIKVIELADTTKDLEELAQARFKLAEIYTVIGDFDKAHQWLKQARLSYAFLGDKDTVALIEEQLDELNQ